MNFGQNLYNWFLSNAQSLVLLAVVWYGALNGPINAATNVVWGLLYDGTGWVDAIASRVVVWDIIRSGTVV